LASRFEFSSRVLHFSKSSSVVDGHVVNVGHASCTFDEGFPEVTEDTVPDRGRIATLVGEHLSFVWRLLRRFGVPLSDVDDAAQRVFLAASDKVDRIEPGRERSFLAGTALRVASAWRRDAKRRPEVATSDFDDLFAAGPAPDEEAESREALALLDEILDEMPDELRVVVVLCDVEQLTVPEVAALQGAPVGTISSRLRRARKELAERIKRLQAKRAYGGRP
jgi:RNA polymerase sigma-70 factor (ECF subfamily)